MSAVHSKYRQDGATVLSQKSLFWLDMAKLSTNDFLYSSYFAKIRLVVDAANGLARTIERKVPAMLERSRLLLTRTPSNKLPITMSDCGKTADVCAHERDPEWDKIAQSI